MKGTHDGGCDWKCDFCDAYLNNQRGFNVLKGTWRCKKCGALNDVSQNNLRNLLGMTAKGVTDFVARPLREPNKPDD